MLKSTLLPIHWTLHVIRFHKGCGWDPQFLPKQQCSDDCHVATGVTGLGANLKQIGRDEADRGDEVNARTAVTVLATPCAYQPQDPRPVLPRPGPA